MSIATEKQFETVIGLEVHLQFHTKTKIFCGCANDFGRDPNSHTCPVCLGLPGTLPVLNKTALQNAVKVGLALNCTINRYIKFDRKNYYYPDLPKGYQISQYDLPIARQGFLMIPAASESKKIGIVRAHLEEDAGKLIHDGRSQSSLVDYNRTGTPLLEIVSGPDLRSPQEAYDYLQTLKLILQYLDVSDCDMEKGSLRCDANISIRRYGEKEFGTKAEVKNMNSFRAVKAALEYEEIRQSKTILAGERIIQETRLWNEDKGMTFSMRSKEEAHDYRYFPEPDLVPFTLTEQNIEDVRRTLPELPQAKLQRLQQRYDIPAYDAQIIIQDVDLANFFEQCAVLGGIPVKKICNWIIGPLQQELNARKLIFRELKLTAQNLVDLIAKVENGVVSNLVGKDILKDILDSSKSAAQIIQEKGLAQVSDDGTLEKIIDEVIVANATVVNQIKEGKDSAMGFLVGQVMKKSQGKANPKKAGELIRRRLSP